jgi:hypothetical protein
VFNIYSSKLCTMDSGLTTIEEVCKNLLIVSIARLILAGVYRKRIAERLPDPVFKRFIDHVGIQGDKARKLYENLFYAIWHTMSFVSVILTLLKEEWFMKYWETWDAGHSCYGFPHHISQDVKSVYLLELAFWISCLLFLTVETVRKDTFEMAIHHVATISLIGLSYIFQYIRIGLLVMAIHDIGDIFLYSAKFFNYLNKVVVTNLLFGIFVIVFFISRLVIFPGVIRVAWGPVTGYIENISWRDHTGSILLPSLLVVLQMLHLMWFALIIRMVVRLLRNEKKQVEGDIRSDDEGTSPDQQDRDNLARTKKIE